MSGGLFLNKLIKHVPSRESLEYFLCVVLRDPDDMQEGQRMVQLFVQFLERLIASRQVERSQLQPIRTPFFLSAWWHVQEPESWPIYYLSARRLLTPQTHTSAVQDPARDYVAFCRRFISLAQSLGISLQELEHVCSWYEQQNLHLDRPKKEEARALPAGGGDRQASIQEQTYAFMTRSQTKATSTTGEENRSDNFSHEKPLVSCRTHLQWLLAKIGRKVGCRVWIATSDHEKIYKNERLGDLSLPFLPLLANSAFQKIICRIDVLWLLDDDIVAAYEIEQAHTDVCTSLLRLYDLGALLSSRMPHLCVVAPRDRFGKIRFELSRPTFHAHDMWKRCALISEELLLQHAEHILRWASSPSVVKDLIDSVGGGEQQ